MNTFPDGYRRPHPTGGKAIRLSRIADPVTMRSQIVPMDHSVTVGPLGPTHHTERMVRLWPIPAVMPWCSTEVAHSRSPRRHSPPWG